MTRISTHQQAERYLADGFAAIWKQFQLPRDFPASVNEVVRQSRSNLSDPNNWIGGERRDATDLPLVTLDPAESTDLDQAFYLERRNDSIVLHYALADVGAFVAEGGTIEQEAWARGVTIYGLAEKVSLYPREISQQAASLLPDGPRPAILVVVAIDPDGQLKLQSVERVVCRSRAKLAYATVDIDTIDHLEEFAQRMFRSEVERGAIRLRYPEQEVVEDPSAPGGVRLDLKSPLYSEQVNAALSLAVNIAIAQRFEQARTGLFRIMSNPEASSLQRLRYEAHALGINWAQGHTLQSLLSRLDPDNIVHKRFLLTVRRAGGRASYSTYTDQPKPWHFAIAAPYSHATAPMRRLADRYVLEAILCLCNGTKIPGELNSRFEMLPQAMAEAEGRARAVSGAVIDLMEAVALQPRIGEVIKAEVVDAAGKIVQPLDSSIRSRAIQLPKVNEGDVVHVRIDQANPVTRKVVMTAVDSKTK